MNDYDRTIQAIKDLDCVVSKIVLTFSFTMYRIFVDAKFKKIEFYIILCYNCKYRI